MSVGAVPPESSGVAGSVTDRHVTPPSFERSSVAIDVDGAELPVYQCDECIDQVDMGLGKPVDVSLTFAVSADGTIIDPAEPTRQIRFNDASD